jgi:drug/metabolite transporter (DMT)-like permease
MTWFVLAFGAAILWAFGHVFLKRGFDHIPPLWNNVLDKVISLLIWVPLILILSDFNIASPPPSVLVIIVSAAGLYLFFFYAISKGQISLTGTIVAGYPLFTVILSHIILKEQLMLLQYLGIALILTGDTIVALPEGGKRRRVSVGRRDYSWILWGFIGALSLGVGDFLTKMSVNVIGSYSHIFWLALISNGAAGCNFLVDRENRTIPPIFRRKGIPTLIGIVVNLIGALFFLLAFDYGAVSLIASVSSVYPALMALLAVKFLNETISWRHGAGIAIAIIGLILIGMGTF